MDRSRSRKPSGCSGREALLQPAILCLDNFDHLIAGDNVSKAQLELCSKWCEVVPGSPSFLAAVHGARMGFLEESTVRRRAVHRFPTSGKGSGLWEAEASHSFQLAGNVDLGAIASKFRLSPEARFRTRCLPPEPRRFALAGNRAD